MEVPFDLRLVQNILVYELVELVLLCTFLHGYGTMNMG